MREVVDYKREGVRHAKDEALSNHGVVFIGTMNIIRAFFHFFAYTLCMYVFRFISETSGKVSLISKALKNNVAS